ncbi:MAG: VCBS repeat-containing protein [Planctomycetes bacterium]|nr:VCBS repeat-containing protein [Planctomycetota bacterium]
MDVNGDGQLDILSGSYSRQDRAMAGLFQILYGKADGGFAKPVVLNGTDEKPLLLPGDSEDTMTDRICTRPTAVDLDGDDKLDIVSGNFSGTFFVFAGEGKGRFAPLATQLRAGEKPLRVEMHSDPFFVDWDKDGDLDLLSGSAQGGVYYAENTGTKTKPEFQAFVEMVAPAGHHSEAAVTSDDEHFTAPGGSTRVWADDVDGDGDLDLLIGDQVELIHPAEGVDLATAKQRFTEWQAQLAKLMEASPWNAGQEPDAAATEAWQKSYQELDEALEKFAKRQHTGYVWLLKQEKLSGNPR